MPIDYIPNIPHRPNPPMPGVGAGSPEGVVTGYPGDQYWDQTGNTFYVKDSGDGTNTGWVAGGGGGGGSGAQYSGVGSPEGVVTGSVGDIYIQTDTGSIWAKVSGSGNVGWQ